MNLRLQILKQHSLILQKCKNVKNFKTELILISKWPIQHSQNCRMIYKKMKICPLDIASIKILC